MNKWISIKKTHQIKNNKIRNYNGWNKLSKCYKIMSFNLVMEMMKKLIKIQFSILQIKEENLIF